MSTASRALARIHAEELGRHSKSAAKKSGVTGKVHAGAVTFVQRFGSSLNLHVHLHTCALDGVYVDSDDDDGPSAAPRFVPALPPSRARSSAHTSPSSPRGAPPIESREAAGERPPPRDKAGPVVPTALPVSATTLARSIDGALVPMPGVLSAKHLDRIAGGLLYAATSKVPWATLLARTFALDVGRQRLLPLWR